QSEKCAAPSFHHKVPQIVVRAESKIPVYDSPLIKTAEIPEGFLCLFRKRSVNDTAVPVHPALGIRAEAVEHGIQRIAGTGASHQIRIAYKAHRFLALSCAHAVFHKSLHDLKPL